MTVLARLEALERGQSDILKELGDVKETVGRVDGTLTTFLHRWEQECLDKHAHIDERFDKLEKRLESVEGDVTVLKGERTGRIAQWSLGKKIWVGLVALGGFVLVCFGITEAAQRIFGA